ncbi:MupA/Atu3671 family FMN-dependent luciferase-like monooxygenase [Actinoplanes sp. NPDC026619]|uniref:MupA/Atu3671 family FMN-dependent luciferase-like monooxygenase n=1 Tax=Actinoplanes sp. NPDC026619 TaxID=3155798 RepID=UPI0033D344A6
MPGTAPKLSVFFFSSVDGDASTGRYDFVLRTTLLAERLGFSAVWLPERHFHVFGGLFPNPAVLASALATRTERIALRAGSVVAPLHHPARIAEDWAMVDALSEGRAGLSLATGWNVGDFVLSRSPYDERRELTFATVDVLRALWEREQVTFDSEGQAVPVRTYPTPVLNTLPLWLTATSGPATYLEAARRGCRVLTGYLQQKPDAVAANILAYRAAFVPYRAGDRPWVTLMMHTCVAEDRATAMATVAEPMLAYQQQFLGLGERGALRTAKGDELTEDEKGALARYAAYRYASECGLVGGPTEVAARLGELAANGVDEVACLIDFGLPGGVVADTLHRLAAITDLVPAG